MTRLELEPGARVTWVPLSLLGGAAARGYEAKVEDVRRKVVLRVGPFKVQAPAGDLQEVEHGQPR